MTYSLLINGVLGAVVGNKKPTVKEAAKGKTIQNLEAKKSALL